MIRQETKGKTKSPEESKKKKNLCLFCQVTPSWSQICKEVFKSLAVEGGWDHYLFWMGPIYIFLAA